MRKEGGNGPAIEEDGLMPGLIVAAVGVCMYVCKKYRSLLVDDGITNYNKHSSMF